MGAKNQPIYKKTGGKVENAHNTSLKRLLGNKNSGEVNVGYDEGLQEASGLDESGGDTVRIDVGSGTPVLEVAESLLSDVSGNTDGSTTMGNTRREGRNAGGLVSAGETEVVVLAVHSDVLVVPLGELLDGSLDGLHSAFLAHGLGGVVRVAASAVPVALERLGVEGDLDAPLFGYPDEQEAGHPEVVAHGDTLARTDLEFPLRGHDLGVDTGDVDTSVDAGAVVGLDQVTSEDLAGT